MPLVRGVFRKEHQMKEKMLYGLAAVYSATVVIGTIIVAKELYKIDIQTR